MNKVLLFLFSAFVPMLSSAHCDSIRPLTGVTYFGVTQFRQVGPAIGTGGIKVEPSAVLTTNVVFGRDGLATPTLTFVVDGQIARFESPRVPFTVKDCGVSFAVPNIPIGKDTITNQYTLELRVLNNKTWQARSLSGYVVIPEWGASFAQNLGFGHWE